MPAPATSGRAGLRSSQAYSVGYIIASPNKAAKEKVAEADSADASVTQHPSRELLKKNGFIQCNYDIWHDNCIKGASVSFIMKRGDHPQARLQRGRSSAWVSPVK